MTGKKVVCPLCKKDIGKSGSIKCKTCESWFHLPCAGVDDGFLALSLKNSGIFFKCKNCANNSEDPTNISNEISIVNKKLDNLSLQISNNNVIIDKKLENIVTDIRNEFVSRFTKLEEEVVNCNALVKSVDDGVNFKMKKLEVENNTLYHRMNRADIVITGIPKGLPTLVNTIKDMCTFFKINIVDRDIQHVCYMNKKESVLVKFGNVMVRDLVMAEYHKTRSLKLGDIDKSGITTRVYLNDHFAPMASKMNYICRQLIKKGKIKKFKIYNADMPKISITYKNGSEVLMGFEKFAKEVVPMIDD